MRRSILVLAFAMAIVTSTAAGAVAADLETSWGSGGTASFALPAGTTLTDTATLPDGSVVAVGHQSGVMPWGATVSPDGMTMTPLTGFTMPDTRFDAVITGNNRIYVVGDANIGLGTSTVVVVYDLAGAHISSHSFAVSEFTVPTSAAVDAGGRLFVAGTGRGDDDGAEYAWVVRLTTAGVVDTAFPTLLLDPPEAGSTNPVGYVAVTEGQAVAVVTGDDNPAPGSSIGFHRITESGSVFMADFSPAQTIASADIDASTGRAVFGSLTPGTTLTAVSYAIHSIGITGVYEQTAVGSWIDAAGRIEVGRTRTNSLLGAGEADVNSFVDLVSSGTSFAGRSEAELIDIATSPVDGAVYLSTQDAVSDNLIMQKYVGDTSGRFVDDDGSVHETDIELFAALGVTRGCNPPINDQYCPTESVTRGQMAAFLNRALALPASSVDFFADDNGSTFEDDINAIAAAGITRGCNPPTNDNYCPNSSVTRAQMASFIVRAIGS